MSVRPKLDATELERALGGEAPRELTIEGRVAMLDEVFRALLEDRKPSRAAALFTGGGGLSWLQQGGHLTRDFWKVVTPKSHRTASVIWGEQNPHKYEREADDDSQ